MKVDDHIQRYRLSRGPLASSPKDGCNGMFIIPKQNGGKIHYVVQISDGMGWEHASISICKVIKGTIRPMQRTPSWEEMCEVKDIFWNAEDTVIQFHPAEKDYVNTHPHVLHLWRTTAKKQPLPDPFMVGFTSEERKMQNYKDFMKRMPK